MRQTDIIHPSGIWVPKREPVRGYRPPDVPKEVRRKQTQDWRERQRKHATCAYSAVSHTSLGPSSGNTGGTSSAIDTTGASLLVIFIGCGTGGSITVSDNQGNTWIGLTQRTNNGAGVRGKFYYVANPTVSASHTVTVGATDASFEFTAFSGAKTASPFDQENANEASSTSAQPGIITPTEDNELIVCGMVIGGSISNLTIDSSMSILDFLDISGGHYFGTAMAWKAQTTASAINPTWNWTTSNGVATCIASFKAAAAAGGWGPLVDSVGQRNSLVIS